MKAIKHLGETLAAARGRAGLTQRQLAARARTAQSLVARVERGNANPTLGTLIRLFDAAGAELELDVRLRNDSDRVVEIYKRDIDRTLLHENLRKTVAERVATLAAMSRFHDEAGRSRPHRKTR